jgi:hypothetical protein
VAALFVLLLESQPMTIPSTISIAELRELAGRLDAASRSIRLARPLRADLLLAARLLDALLQTGVIAKPVELRD